MLAQKSQGENTDLMYDSGSQKRSSDGEAEGSDEWDSNKNEDTDEPTTEQHSESGAASGSEQLEDEREDISIISVGGPSNHVDEDGTTKPGDSTAHMSMDPVDSSSGSSGEESAIDLSLDYIASPDRVREWKTTLEELQSLVDESWTGSSRRELVM